MQAEQLNCPVSKVAEERGKITHSVHLINVLSTLVLLSLDPVLVQIVEKLVDVQGASGVPVPLTSIILEKFLVRKFLGLLRKGR